MKKRRILIIFLTLILLLGALSACAPKYEFETAQGFSCLDYMNTGWDVEKTDGYKTKTDRAEYFFATDISETDRTSFIKAQEKIFRQLAVNGFAEREVFPIYILSDCQGFARSKIIYPAFPQYSPMFLASVNDTGTYTQVLLTLQAIYGEMTNYGLMYGLSNIIAEKLNFTSDSTNEPIGSLKSFWETFENQPLSDLTYPCFIEPYATEQETKIVKQTSNNLTKFVFGKDNGKTLQTLLAKDFNEFEESFAEWKNSWLKSIGSDVVIASRVLPITFAYGGSTYPLVFKTPRALYAITGDYADLYSTLCEKDYMKSDYVTLISTICIFESEMNNVAAKLEDPDHNYGQYSVVFRNEGSRNNAGIYYISSSRSYIKTVYATLHEYVHHLTRMYYDIWTYEAIAYHYGDTGYFDKYINYVMVKDIHPDIVELIACEIYLGREYEIDDLPVLMDIGILLSDRHKKVFDGNDYPVCFAFGNYLAAKYGEDALIKLYTSHCDSPQAITGKTWRELQEEWSTWLESEYGYLRDLVEMP